MSFAASRDQVFLETTRKIAGQVLAPIAGQVDGDARLPETTAALS
jgi:hypothetical protein